MTVLWILTTTIFTLICGICLRLRFILPASRPKAPRRQSSERAHLMIFLGSGGHTTEMLLGLRQLDTRRYNTRTWVYGKGDGFSEERALKFEEALRIAVFERAAATGNGTVDLSNDNYGTFELCSVPRARRVHQPLYTAPFSALQCLLSSIKLLAYGCDGTSRKSGFVKDRLQGNDKATVAWQCPNIIVTNGPGSAVILILSALLLRFFDFTNRHYNQPARLRTVYFESWARVTSLSLSGKLLERLVDRFIVQWPQLQSASREFRGWLVIDEGAAG